MSIDRSLRLKGDLRGARSVLTRAERIAKMIEEGKFDPEKDSALGLPKTRVKVSKVGSKSKKEEAPAEAEAAEGAEAAKGAEAAAE
jgi:small basic protein (TIGR04137 family)